MIIVYAIKSLVRNYIYVGMTNNLNRRIAEHNNGKNKSTKAYKPFVVIYSEEFASRKEAPDKGKIFKKRDWERVSQNHQINAEVAKLVDALL